VFVGELLGKEPVPGDRLFSANKLESVCTGGFRECQAMGATVHYQAAQPDRTAAADLFPEVGRSVCVAGRVAAEPAPSRLDDQLKIRKLRLPREFRHDSTGIGK
jgi:hypothetical protein